MQKLKQSFNKVLKNFPNQSLLLQLVVIGVFVGGGILFLSISRAATGVVSLQPEGGALASGARIIADTSASGGSAIAFGTPTTPGNSPLPFDLPTQATLKASPKKVFAHYFTPYPISLDNKPEATDYYTTQLMDPNGENGKHRAYGGFFRDRPLGRAPLTVSNWEMEDLKTSVRQATQAGLDGFTMDLLTLNDGLHQTAKNMYAAAAAVDPNFKIVIMPDAATLPQDSAALGKAVAEFAAMPASYKLADGSLVVAPFFADNWGATWWRDWITMMNNTYGIKIAFYPCFLDYRAAAPSFASISYGFSNWGQRSPAGNQNIASDITYAHGLGKQWMQPVSVQDNRPYDGSYAEAANSENLRLTWNGAIGGADWVQIVTWNDYSEHAHMAPSKNIGWSPLDISSYYITRMKTGQWPTITKDALYVSHRIQPYAALPTGGQTLLMKLAGGNTPARDTVEVLSFLPSAGTVEVKVGTNTYTYEAAAGVFAKTYPLAVGNVSARVIRSGATTAQANSPFPVVARPVVQDMLYHYTSSTR